MLESLEGLNMEQYGKIADKLVDLRHMEKTHS